MWICRYCSLSGMIEVESPLSQLSVAFLRVTQSRNFAYVLLKQCHCEFFHDSWCKNILFLLRLTCIHYTSVSIDNCVQVRFKPMTGIWECMECYIHRIIVEETVLTLLTMIALRWASVLVVNSGTRLFWLGHESNGAHYFVSFHAYETV